MDRENFNFFCAGQYPSLIAYASLFLRGEDRLWAEDVVQDVFYSVWKRRFFLRRDSAQIHGYLLRSVYNHCMNYLRHQRTRRAYEERESSFLAMAEQYYDPDRNPVIKALFDRDLHSSLDRSIDALPDKCREVFRLSYVEGYSHKEIADLLGISVRTVDAHIYAALRSLRTALENNCP